MKKMTLKYTWLSVVFIGLVACDVNNDLDPITEKIQKETIISLESGSADFSNYVAVGASFTAGYTDGAVFKEAQKNSFPATLASKFAMAGGGEFTQPLMNDNFGGFTIAGKISGAPRFYFNGSAPVVLAATPTTEISNIKAAAYNNMGIPGLKSYHLGVKGYGALAGLPNANPYFIRMASSPMASVLEDVITQSPTFFSLSEIGGNDVLSYAVSGGVGVDQKGNLNPATYGSTDITDPTVFASVFSTTVTALISNGAKGVVANLPEVTSLPYFTTVPYAPLNPADPAFGTQIPTLNNVFGAINGVFEAIGVPERAIVFVTDAANPVVIKDEALEDKTAQIIGTLLAIPSFTAFVAGFGLPTDASTLQKVAGLLGTYYGQARQATADDLLVLPSSSIIGKVNANSVKFLLSQGLPAQLAGMFSVEGVSLPLADKWVLTTKEIEKVKTATTAYNSTIKNIVTQKGLAFVDFNAILKQAATSGLDFDNYNMTTSFVTGGLVSLDGVHLTARGYALMANEMLKAIDKTYGSNFESATNGLAKAADFPTGYAATLK
ncbi:G-D-S-L family lipolytic protein [Tenacibaculum finnmarkense genomovar finnmarkense]|uniref:SGNH/GDSL hydrolase family protein n=2 Tax=Tenacibaculum finnmarkense TaxID=2781243 RepID=UPI001E33FD17|nr:G-D-S-L family lipolytic protein [Tenacibaculum finnmarkense]MCD8417178.1 G-D-S-L family lipolytic protein [Tenacibaculum finnmarkense genomovar finnmarkense]MCG8185561.1 G-D-S-L family lipolytic protein [Tenacibaculum finnmarkense genomovar finnmarkense]MCG8202109.1 G-D-S-L family lipolytic protein [Tenacibaculum finnmarkense genomovar finnmarkense]MCG8209603.1 G-D-S-L family lipolytic protein [Tenacibaculum finnmarkense genomovar finnmarkense]MCG8212401.1 G-D-S-L family lipolytic protein 